MGGTEFPFLLLQRGYREGDVSLVYPLARGTGPMLSIAAAIAFLGERPAPVGLTGAVLVVFGVLLLTGDARLFKGAEARRAVAFGVPMANEMPLGQQASLHIRGMVDINEFDLFAEVQ